MKILHLEDEPLDSELASARLNADGIWAELDRVDTLPALREALQRGGYSLVLSDYTLPGTDPLQALRLVRQFDPDLPFIFFSGTIGEDRATETLKLGANDYVLKQRIERLAPTVSRVLGEARQLKRRKDAEEALRRSEERLRLAQEVARIGTFEADLRSGVHQWSTELEALYGLAPGTFEGTYEAWLKRVHPDDREIAAATLQQGLRGGDFEGEWRTVTAAGEVRWLAARGHVFKNELGEPVRVVGVNIDITQRKHDEESLKAAKHTAERAKEVAEEANRAKDRFLAILSHELRTPLTAVLPALEAMEPLVPEAAREYVEMATRNVELEARLIDDLLDITRIARGKIELHRQTIDVCAVLRRAADVCRTEIASKGLHFLLRIEDSPHEVQGDPARLQQVFWNLIQNAVKFTPPGGCLGVRACKQEGKSVIEVCDSGTGIEGEALLRIFNAFEQEAKSVTRQFGGLGLGLAISKALAEMHSGSITARSEGKGKGASFSVTLPLMESRPEEAVAAEGKPISAPGAQHLRVLLVEDHADTARILSVLLRKAGHEVRHAPDSASGLRLAKEHPFDVLLSDLGLPDGTGHDLLKRLRSESWSPPAIALSGYGTAADIERSRLAGFAEHIVKPVNLSELLGALSRVASSVPADR